MQTPSAEALPWHDVRLFLTCFRSRTLGEAAAALRVDISTVSRRLTALEEALDSSLFDRGRDGLRPTKAAEDLFPAATRVEDGMTEFVHAAEGLERDISGTVRVACPPDAAEVVVLPLVKALLRRHPRLRVSLAPGEETVDLNRREADIALRIVRPTQGDLVMRRVLELGFRPAASPELAARLGTLTQFSAAPWVGWHSQLGPAARWLDEHLDCEPVLRTDSLRTQIAAAGEGIGVAIVPEPSIPFYGLVEVPLGGSLSEAGESLPKGELYMVTHRALRNVPRVRAVWDAVVALYEL